MRLPSIFAPIILILPLSLAQAADYEGSAVVVDGDTIDYVATDTWGNTATSTRTVTVEAAASSLSAQ